MGGPLHMGDWPISQYINDDDNQVSHYWKKELPNGKGEISNEPCNVGSELVIGMNSWFLTHRDWHNKKSRCNFVCLYVYISFMYANTHAYCLALSLRGLGNKQRPNTVGMNTPRTQIMSSKYHSLLREPEFFGKRANVGAWTWNLQNEPGMPICQEARKSTNDGTRQMVTKAWRGSYKLNLGQYDN